MWSGEGVGVERARWMSVVGDRAGLRCTCGVSSIGNTEACLHSVGCGEVGEGRLGCDHLERGMRSNTLSLDDIYWQEINVIHGMSLS